MKFLLAFLLSLGTLVSAAPGDTTYIDTLGYLRWKTPTTVGPWEYKQVKLHAPSTGATYVDSTKTTTFPGPVVAGNFNRLKYDLPKWKAAYYDAINGIARAKICLYGTSHIAGAGTGTNGTGLSLTGAAKRRNGYLLAQLLKQRVGTGQQENFTGFVATGDSPIATYDPRFLAVSAGVLTPVYGFGGYWGSFTNVNDSVEFMPETAWDRLEVTCFTAGNASSIRASIAAQNTTLDLSVNTGYTTFTVNAPTKAVQSFRLKCLSGPGTAFFGRANVWASDALGIEVYSAGWIGAYSSDLAQDGSWWTLPGLRKLAPHLTIIDAMPNDLMNSVSAATYKGYLATIVTAAQLSGDVLIRGTYPMNNVNVTPTTYAAYLAAARAVGDSLKVNVIDPRDWMGTTYATANAAGLLYSDGVHASFRGSRVDADWMANLVIPRP